MTAGTMDSAEAVYAEVRARLGQGRYAPGDRLTELGLAAELGVSRTPIREALRRLQADGLVARANRGVVVAALTPKERADLFAVRAVLEGLAAAAAARRQADGALAPVVLRELRGSAAAIADAVDAGGDPRTLAQLNFQLHLLIAEAADNPSLEEILRRVWDRIAVSAVSNLGHEAWARQASSHHEAVIDAIERGDEAAARDAMASHIEAAGRPLDATG